MTGELTAVSLFAGIEGIGLALERAGIRVVAAVEIDPACRSVIARHFPDVTLFNDVTEVTGDQLRAAGFDPARGILAAGWPCQGNSIAGRRQGMADPRSNLWVHVARLLADLRPKWFLGENVPGLYTVNGGRDIAVVRSDLAQRGYWWAERILDAQYFGVPQRRRRIYFAGCLGNRAAPVSVLFEPESRDRDPAAGRETWPGTAAPPSSLANGTGTVATLQGGGRRGHRIDVEGAAGGHLVAVPFALRGRDDGSQDGTGRGTPLVAHAITARERKGTDSNVTSGNLIAAPTLTAGWGTNHGAPGHGGKDDAALAITAAGAAIRRLTPRECERLQGFPDDWTRHLADGRQQSDSARYRQLGNAVAVPVAEWIAHRIAATEAAA